MLRSRTHYEQIPLEVVKAIAEEEPGPEKAPKPAQRIEESNNKKHTPRTRTPGSRGIHS